MKPYMYAMQACRKGGASTAQCIRGNQMGSYKFVCGGFSISEAIERAAPSADASSEDMDAPSQTPAS